MLGKEPTTEPKSGPSETNKPLNLAPRKTIAIPRKETTQGVGQSKEFRNKFDHPLTEREVHTPTRSTQRVIPEIHTRNACSTSCSI